MSGVLLPYQQRWIADRSPVKICEKSRRIGITWATAAEAVYVAASPASFGGMDVWYSVSHEDDAREFILDCKKWADAFAVTCTDPAEEMIRDPDGDALAFVIRFATGHRIRALSSNPRRLRGKKGYAIKDEAAHADDLAAFIAAAGAFTIWGGRVAIMSTHNGAESEFAHLIDRVRAGKLPGHTVHRITLDDALAEGLYGRIAMATGQPDTVDHRAEWRDALIKRYAPHAEQELFCVPESSGGVYMPRAIVEPCCDDSCRVLRWHADDTYGAAPPDERAAVCAAWIESELMPLLARLDHDRAHGIGLDFGRESDLTSVAIMEVSQSLVRRVPLVIELGRIPYPQQEAIVSAVIRRLKRFDGAHVDATGNGLALAEALTDRWGTAIVSVKITQQWHADAWPKLRAAFEDRKIEIPADSEIVDDLRSVRNVDGTPKIPRRSKSDRGVSRHGDTAVAIAMAYLCTWADGGPIEFHAVGRDSSDFDPLF